MKRIWVLAFIVGTLIPACAADITSTTDNVPTRTLSSPTTESVPSVTQTRKPQPISPITPVPPLTSTATSAVHIPMVDPLDWKSWPVTPENIDLSLQKVYARGLALGNDPHAFSIFGDCQARPDEFFGRFETDPDLVESLPPELRETVEYFQRFSEKVSYPLGINLIFYLMTH